MSSAGALCTGLLTSDHRSGASTGSFPSPAATPWKSMGAREETQRRQASKRVSLSPYSPRLSWQWGAEVWRATPLPPGIRHRCLSGNHCVCLLCPLLPLPAPTSPYPRLLLRLSLEVMTILCRCENIETSEGVPLFVTGVAQVITHLLPPLCLTFSLPAPWGLAGRTDGLPS